MDTDLNAALNTLARARSASVLWVGQTHWGKSTDNSLGLPQEATPLHRTCVLFTHIDTPGCVLTS